MKQVQLKLLLSLLLATVATARYPMGSVPEQNFGAQPYGIGRQGSPGMSGFQAVSSMGPIGAVDSSQYATYQTPPSAPVNYSPQPSYSNGGSSYGQSFSYSPPAPRATSSYGSLPQAKSRGYGDASYAKSGGYGDASYGGSAGYGGSYGAEPTGAPYGIQSSGDYVNYNYEQEPLDLSRCGPPPAENPCTAYGPQYFPLPGFPNCYIQCAFERLFVKPCSANLVWNERINVCDWPTVASSVGSDDSYGSSSYGNGGNSYRASSYGASGNRARDSYGRKKRLTAERKKRQYFPIPPTPIGGPVYPFALPGPVGFSGSLGIPPSFPFLFPLGGYNDYGGRGSYGNGYRKNNGMTCNKKKYSEKKSYGGDKNKYDDAEDEDNDCYNSYSQKSNYKKNGNFNSYRGSSKNYKKYDEDDDDDYSSNYYRKKRQYDSNIEEEAKVSLKTVPRSPAREIQTTYNPTQGSSYGSTEQSSLIPDKAISPLSFELATLCASKTTKANIAHPTDPTKYVACLSKTNQEIMDCPAGLVYSAAIDLCEKIRNPELICDQEQPCLNNGQCHQTTPTTFKCTCLSGWTGERCETQASSCAANPCGENNQCHSLKTRDYKQDFVCVCDEHKSYGLTCGQNTVPNPCLTASSEQDQYFPFAFSGQAFVQCNGDILYVQPCAAGLFWDQEMKVCDQAKAPPAPSAQDQSVHFQRTFGTEEQSTYARPTATFSDRAFIKPQSYSTETRNAPLMINDQGPSSYESKANRPFNIKDIPAINSYSTPSSDEPVRVLKSQPLTPSNNYGSSQEQLQRGISADAYSWSSPHSKSITVQANEKPQQYGQPSREKLLIRNQPAPFDTSLKMEATEEPQQYGQASRQKVLIRNQPAPFGTSINMEATETPQLYGQASRKNLLIRNQPAPFGTSMKMEAAEAPQQYGQASREQLLIRNQPAPFDTSLKMEATEEPQQYGQASRQKVLIRNQPAPFGTSINMEATETPEQYGQASRENLLIRNQPAPFGTSMKMEAAEAPQQYGQASRQKVLIRNQPVPFGTSMKIEAKELPQQYGVTYRQQPETIFIPQQSRRLLTRVFQPESVRPLNTQSAPSGYRR